MFVKYRAFRHAYDFGVTLRPPEGEIEQALSNWILTSSVAAGIDLAYDDTVDPNERTFNAYLGNPMRSTLIKFNRDWKWAGDTTTSGLTVSLDDAWENFWPLPVLSQLVAVRVIPTDNDNFLPGAPIDLFAITTA